MQSFVEENYYRKDKFGAICIIKSLEFMGCFWNKQVKTKSGKLHTSMYWCKKQVTQHYIYFNDKALGLCCLKISSGFPIHCQFYFNGHYYLRRQFDKRGIKYKIYDYAFTEIGDMQLLQGLLKDFKGSIIKNIQMILKGGTVFK